MTNHDLSMADSGLPDGLPAHDALEHQTAVDSDLYNLHLQDAQEPHSPNLEQGLLEEPWGIDNINHLDSPHWQDPSEVLSDIPLDHQPELPDTRIEEMGGEQTYIAEESAEEMPTAIAPDAPEPHALSSDSLSAGLESSDSFDSTSSIPHPGVSLNPEGLANPAPQPEMMESAQSCLSNNPYITVSQSGAINYHSRFSSPSRWVGTVHGNSFENRSGNDLGYVKDGTVYDHWKRIVGSVHGGKIFNSRGVQIGTADNDIEGASYIFFIVKGGVQ